ncbi:MAG: 3'-5' exonuclease, partial [Holophaga sp.]
GDRNAVQILTLHAAKGLEAPIVAIFAFGKPQLSSLRRFHHHGERCLALGDAAEEWVAQAKQEASDEHERLLYVGLTRAQAKLILCAFEQRTKEGKLAKLNGPYDALNQRLVELQSQREDLFTWHPLPALGRTPLEARTRRLPEDFALPTAPTPATRWDYEGLAKAARPFFTTSFTALQSRIDAEEQQPDDADPPGLQPHVGELPKGTHTGRALHELLEWADLASLGSLDEWSRRADVRTQILATLNVHGLAPTWQAKVAQLVHTGLSSDLPLAWGGALCIAKADRVLRELDFLARFLPAETFPQERDLLQGSIDVVCEHGGRLYLVDWKSNLLPDYTWDTLQDCVNQHYQLQAQVYLQAALACFNIRDEATYEAQFGGILYVFLRGLPQEGTWSIRPTWAEVQAWKQALVIRHHEVAHG